jgi:hypothetical protein
MTPQELHKRLQAKLGQGKLRKIPADLGRSISAATHMSPRVIGVTEGGLPIHGRIRVCDHEWPIEICHECNPTRTGEWWEVRQK